MGETITAAAVTAQSRAMAPTDAPTTTSAGTPTWRAVSDLVDLVEIFDPDVQVCVWQRETDPSISAYLTGLEQTTGLQAMETLSAEARPQLARLPAAPGPVAGRAALIEDLAFMREITCDLLGCPAVGLRLARVGHAMCPGWHIDRVGVRLICTYQGPGTQWLEDQSVDRCNLGSRHVADGAFNQAAPGQVVLLKGALWQGNERFGAIHRSPQIAPGARVRTLITLDPLWQR